MTWRGGKSHCRRRRFRLTGPVRRRRPSKAAGAGLSEARMSSSIGSEPSLAPDLYDYDFENNPIATLNRLRAEDPVHWSRHGVWYLTRYEDCATVLKDPVRFSSMAAGWGGENPLARRGGAGAQSADEQGISRNLAVSFNQMDPPDHTRIRALVVRAFSRRSIEDRRDRIQQVIDERLDAAAAKGAF